MLTLIKKELAQYHFSLGIWIRNHWVYHNPEILAWFINHGISYPDDMSEIILKSFQQWAENKPY